MSTRKPHAAPCKPLCELCVKRGYVACANTAKTTPIIVRPVQPAPIKVETAIAQLVEALCQLKGWMHAYAEAKVRDVLDADIAQPVQPAPSCERCADEIVESNAGWCVNCINLPTAAQPLTDEDLELICAKALFCRVSFQQFARAIEAAHGIGDKA